MPREKYDKIKIYLLTVLTLVLVALGYFRFLHRLKQKFRRQIPPHIWRLRRSPGVRL